MDIGFTLWHGTGNLVSNKGGASPMNYQHIENLLIRYRGQVVNMKTVSGGIYEGLVNDVTNDYVALKISDGVGGEEVVFVLLHAIESILPQRS